MKHAYLLSKASGLPGFELSTYASVLFVHCIALRSWPMSLGIVGSFCTVAEGEFRESRQYQVNEMVVVLDGVSLQMHTCSFLSSVTLILGNQSTQY